MKLVVRGWILLASMMALGACVAGEGGEQGGDDDEGSSGSPAVQTGSCSAGASSAGEGPTMRPGGACISCHASGEGPHFTIAGTVMGTSAEATGCNGASGAQVEITDASGQVLTLGTNAVGNFYSSSPVSFPITARVLAGGKVLAMASPQSSGDCNSCHTAAGANGAPGRVLTPN
jgi:hypothetical protein